MGVHCDYDNALLRELEIGHGNECKIDLVLTTLTHNGSSVEFGRSASEQSVPDVTGDRGPCPELCDIFAVSEAFGLLRGRLVGDSG